MQIQIQILIQLQYLPSWVPWRGNCLPPFPHNALPSIPRAEISLSTILQFHGVHFSIFVYFFHLKRLFVYLHFYLSHTVGRVSPWVRLRLRKFLNFQPRYTPLPLSTADIEIHSSGLGLFRLCPLNIKTNRQQIHHPEEWAITTSGVFQGKPWHLHIQGRWKECQGCSFVTNSPYISLVSSSVTGHRRCDPGSSDLPFPCLPNTQHSLPL